MQKRYNEASRFKDNKNSQAETKFLGIEVTGVENQGSGSSKQNLILSPQ